MKKIIWIASYPKSGNTFMRLLLSSYFYTKDGTTENFETIKNIFSMNHYNIYKNIKNFPTIESLKNNPQQITSYWDDAQKLLSENIKNNLFIKTHNCMAEILHKTFTNEQFTKCFIYIVRDPRSVVISYKHHFITTYDNAIEQLNNKSLIGFESTFEKVPELVSSWGIHYNSWKNFLNKGNGLIIKYEDLVLDPFNTFKKVLIFLNKFLNFEIDEKKIKKSLHSNTLLNLKKIENKEGFIEKPKNTKEFFRKGKIDEWKHELNSAQNRVIIENFHKEMSEIGYLE